LHGRPFTPSVANNRLQNQQNPFAAPFPMPISNPAAINHDGDCPSAMAAKRALPKPGTSAYLEEQFARLGGFPAKSRPVRLHIEE
jgi:hypothetical protein